MAKQRKIQNAYHLPSGKTVSAADMYALAIDHPAIFGNEVLGKLYCPDCRQAKVCLVQNHFPYFRTYPNGVHRADCPLIQEESAQHSTSAASCSPKRTSVVKQMNRLIARYCRASGAENQPSTQKVYDGELRSAQTPVYDVRYRQYVPEKKITPAIQLDEIGIWKIFYGKVLMRWEYDRGTKRMRLPMWTAGNQSSRFLCRLNMTYTDYNSLPRAYKFRGIQEHYVAFFGILSHYECNGHQYLECILTGDEYLKIL